jgi:soluble lytic murein transglycosylase-like protein
MHRLLVVLLVVFSLARPAFADDITNQKDAVKQRLADASVSITRLDGQIVALQSSIAATQLRLDREREQLRVLARVLYAQPAGDNLLMTVVSANSISDAFTRMGDMASAAQQATRTRWALNRDLASLSAQKTQLVADRHNQAETQKKLQAEFDRLVELEAQQQAQLAGLPAPAPATAGAPIAAGGSIEQMILDAFAPLGGGAQQWALRVARCESGYNPNAVNRGSGASGLFQFMPSTWASMPQHTQSVFNPLANAQAAAVLYQRSGPNQWSCK